MDAVFRQQSLARWLPCKNGMEPVVADKHSSN